MAVTNESIVNWVRSVNRMVTVQEVADQFKFSSQAATDHLRRAVDARKLKRVGRGQYEIRQTPGRPPAGGAKKAAAKRTARTTTKKKAPAAKRTAKKQAATRASVPARPRANGGGMSLLRELDGGRLLLEQDGQLWLASRLEIPA